MRGFEIEDCDGDTALFQQESFDGEGRLVLESSLGESVVAISQEDAEALVRFLRDWLKGVKGE